MSLGFEAKSESREEFGRGRDYLVCAKSMNTRGPFSVGKA
jgi:hypothetical protein